MTRENILYTECTDYNVILDTVITKTNLTARYVVTLEYHDNTYHDEFFTDEKKARKFFNQQKKLGA